MIFLISIFLLEIMEYFIYIVNVKMYNYKINMDSIDKIKEFIIAFSKQTLIDKSADGLINDILETNLVDKPGLLELIKDILTQLNQTILQFDGTTSCPINP